MSGVYSSPTDLSDDMKLHEAVLSRRHVEPSPSTLQGMTTVIANFGPLPQSVVLRFWTGVNIQPARLHGAGKSGGDFGGARKKEEISPPYNQTNVRAIRHGRMLPDGPGESREQSATGYSKGS
jgi:hypothetical protein